MKLRPLVTAAAALLLGACASVPLQVAEPVAPPPPPRDLIAELHALVMVDDAIVVEPLPDPEVEDLRMEAERALSLRDLENAALRLAQALELRPGRPDLLQMRAEVALAQLALDDAESFAIASFESGPKLGPLCRRNWAAIQLAREVRGNVEAAQLARDQGLRCTPEPVIRM
jgi:hypothetical protein